MNSIEDVDRQGLVARPQRDRAPKWIAEDLNAFGYGELLSTSPTIIHIFFPSPGLPLGAASMLGPVLKQYSVHYLIMLHRTIELPREIERLCQIAGSYTADHPRHKLTFLCNTSREMELMRGEGYAAVMVNHNCLIDETVFAPLATVEPVYDAVYNACLAEYKRHELAAEIEKLALVYYQNASEPEDFPTQCARFGAMLPTAHFVNGFPPDDWRWIPGNDVNLVYAQSRIGLCLSRVEGAMRASMEYLLAGLSVVSTPSLGGREHFFDDEFCIIAEPDPRHIREAVDALVARNVPREYVRARTLAKVEAERRRYIALVQELIDQGGGNMNFAARFLQLTRGPTISHWRSMTEFSETVALAVRS